MNQANIEIEPIVASTHEATISENNIFARKPGKTLNPFTSNEVRPGRTRNKPE